MFDSLISNGILFLFCLLIMNTLRYYLPRREQIINIFVWCIFFTIIWSGVDKMAASYFTWILRWLFSHASQFPFYTFQYFFFVTRMRYDDQCAMANME